MVCGAWTSHIVRGWYSFRTAHSVEAGKIRLMMKPSPSSQRGMMVGEA